MPSDKKRLTKIVDAVSQFFDYEIIAKNLRKKKALTKFITKLEKRRDELEDRMDNGEKNGKKKKRRQQLHLLKKQIRKAKKLLRSL